MVTVTQLHRNTSAVMNFLFQRDAEVVAEVGFSGNLATLS